MPVGAVELLAERVERVRRVCVEAQASADRGACRRPGRAAEQLRARVGEAPGASHEDIAAVQRALEGLEHAGRVRATIDLPVAELRVLQHEPLPAPVDDRERDRADTHAAAAALQSAQRLQAVEHGPARGCRLEGQVREQGGQDALGGRVAA